MKVTITTTITYYLNPKSMQNNSPKPIITAIRAIVLHTFGVQVLSPSKPIIGLILRLWPSAIFAPPKTWNLGIFTRYYRKNGESNEKEHGT